MDWDNNQILLFLQHYREEPCLWDPSDINYKRKDLNLAAWKRLSECLNKPVMELKRKKESLMATYRSYLRRKKASIGGDGDRVYEPVWFAFSTMQEFLGDKLKANQTLDTVQADSEPIDNSDQLSEDLDHSQPQKRRRKAIESRESEENIEVLSRVPEDDSECELYGQLVAKKLRRIPEWERQLLMYKIDGMIINTMEHCGLFNVTPRGGYVNGRTSNISAREEQAGLSEEVDSKAGITIFRETDTT